MADLLDQVDEARNQVLRDNTAQEIFKQLRKLEDERTLHVSRWIWELLQNARDATRHGQPLRVILSVVDGKLVFAHNGASFTKEEIAHLIYHGSSKQADDAAVGQFGSGFLSTHLLSRRIQVQGLLDDGHGFDFVLNREGNSADELRQAIDESFEAFKSSLDSAHQLGDHTTRYSYCLDAATEELARQGIASLEQCAALVVVFNPMLEGIELVTPEGGQEIQRRTKEDLGGGLSLDRIEFRGARNQELSVLSASGVTDSGTGVTVAVPLGCSDADLAAGGSQEIPRIFIAFPLFGTELLALPYIINSEWFSPREDRDGIVLALGDSPANRLNEEIMLRGADLFVELIKTIAQRKLGNVDVLATPGVLHEHGWLKAEWYRKFMRVRIVASLRTSEILRTIDGTLRRPTEAQIPLLTDVGSLELWDLLLDAREIGEAIPLRESAFGWAAAARSWARVLGEEPEDLSEAFSLKDLAQFVAQTGSVKGIVKELKADVDVLRWLNRLHALLFDSGQEDLFETLALLPDQNGSLKCSDDIAKDEQIDEELKGIAAALGIDVRSGLLDRRVSEVRVLGLLGSKTQTEVLSEAKEALVKFAESANGDDHLVEHSLALFKWIVDHGDLNVLDGFPVATEAWPDAAHGILKLTRTIHDVDAVPLGPLGCWPASVQPFKVLFPSRFVVSSRYFNVCPAPAIWESLQKNNYLATTPLYEKSERVDSFLPDEPLPDFVGKHRATEDADVTAIAFLSKSEVSLIDAARGSRGKAIEFLRMLMSFVLPSDPRALEKVAVTCECGNKHNYYRGYWLTPLKERKWVPLGQAKNDTLNAISLSNLVANERELLESLTREPGSRMLEALGISAADLLLRSVASDEKDRIKLMGSVGDMFRALGGDSDRIRAMADEIRDHPEILDDIERHRDQRAKVLRNQAVGRIVEQLLRRELESAGLRVTRTGVGSDFEVESDVIVEGAESLFEVEAGSRKFLIEVKATSDGTARMTVKQAETAIRAGQGFALCIVRIDPSQIDENTIRAGARFVFDVGRTLKPVFSEYEQLEQQKAKAQVKVGDVQVEIQDSQVRFCFGEDTWDSGKTFGDAVALFVSPTP